MDPNHAYRPGDLPRLWEERAAFLHQYGDPTSARLWQLAAAELNHTLRVLGDETLTLTEAAAACGYSAAHLGHLVASGKIPNVGRKHAPRLRRGDLPVKSTAKPGRPPQTRTDGGQATPITKFRRTS